METEARDEKRETRSDHTEDANDDNQSISSSCLSQLSNAIKGILSCTKGEVGKRTEAHLMEKQTCALERNWEVLLLTVTFL